MFPGSASREPLLNFFSLLGYPFVFLYFVSSLCFIVVDLHIVTFSFIFGRFTSTTYQPAIDDKRLFGFLLLSYPLVCSQLFLLLSLIYGKYNVKGSPYLFNGKERKITSDLMSNSCSFVFDNGNSYKLLGSNDSAVRTSLPSSSSPLFPPSLPSPSSPLFPPLPLSFSFSFFPLPLILFCFWACPVSKFNLNFLFQYFVGEFNNIIQTPTSCSYYNSLQATQDISNTIINMTVASDYSTLQKLQLQVCPLLPLSL